MPLINPSTHPPTPSNHPAPPRPQSCGHLETVLLPAGLVARCTPQSQQAGPVLMPATPATAGRAPGEASNATASSAVLAAAGRPGAAAGPAGTARRAQQQQQGEAEASLLTLCPGPSLNPALLEPSVHSSGREGSPPDSADMRQRFAGLGVASPSPTTPTAAVPGGAPHGPYPSPSPTAAAALAAAVSDPAVLHGIPVQLLPGSSLGPPAAGPGAGGRGTPLAPSFPAALAARLASLGGQSGLGPAGAATAAAAGGAVGGGGGGGGSAGSGLLPSFPSLPHPSLLAALMAGGGSFPPPEDGGAGAAGGLLSQGQSTGVADMLISPINSFGLAGSGAADWAQRASVLRRARHACCGGRSARQINPQPWMTSGHQPPPAPPPHPHPPAAAPPAGAMPSLPSGSELLPLAGRRSAGRAGSGGGGGAAAPAGPDPLRLMQQLDEVDWKQLMRVGALY